MNIVTEKTAETYCSMLAGSRHKPRYKTRKHATIISDYAQVQLILCRPTPLIFYVMLRLPASEMIVIFPMRPRASGLQRVVGLSLPVHCALLQTEAP